MYVTWYYAEKFKRCALPRNTLEHIYLSRFSPLRRRKISGCLSMLFSTHVHTRRTYESQLIGRICNKRTMSNNFRHVSRKKFDRDYDRPLYSALPKLANFTRSTWRDFFRERRNVNRDFRDAGKRPIAKSSDINRSPVDLLYRHYHFDSSHHAISIRGISSGEKHIQQSWRTWNTDRYAARYRITCRD